MFVIRCFDSETGHNEIVGGPIEDFTSTCDGGGIDLNFRRVTVDGFANEDTNTSSVYYADTVEYNGMARILWESDDE